MIIALPASIAVVLVAALWAFVRIRQRELDSREAREQREHEHRHELAELAKIPELEERIKELHNKVAGINRLGRR